jgi:hypothetical protein
MGLVHLSAPPTRHQCFPGSRSGRKPSAPQYITEIEAVFVIVLPSLKERELLVRVHAFGNDPLSEILAHAYQRSIGSVVPITGSWALTLGLIEAMHPGKGSAIRRERLR